MFKRPRKSVTLPNTMNSVPSFRMGCNQRMPLNHTSSMLPVASVNFAVSRLAIFSPNVFTWEMVPRNCTFSISPCSSRTVWKRLRST